MRKGYNDVDVESQGLTTDRPKYDGIQKSSTILGRFSLRKVLFALVFLGIFIGIIVGIVVSEEEKSSDPSNDPIWNSIRLPSYIKPISYDIFLHPNLTSMTYIGATRVTIQVSEATNVILIHSIDHTIQNLTVQDANSNSYAVSKYFLYAENQFLVIELVDPLHLGEYTLTINFNATVREELSGFYRSSYKDNLGVVHPLVTTQFEPTDARKAFPCFDEPALKATFSISIIKDPSFTALSNMPAAQIVPLPNNLERVDFQKSVVMSTYLVAFVVCDFDYVEKNTTRGIQVRVWTPQGKIDQAAYSLDIASRILDYYEDFFGVPYPLPKQDLIAIPDFNAGAMENWGLITYRETALLYNDTDSSAGNQQRVAVVVAHELAHQWFGNLVTMKWWNDLWLNEGFASYVEYLGVSNVTDGWAMETQFLDAAQANAFALDALDSTHPIEVTVNNPLEINEIFDSISYDKGASIIRMLYGLVGADKFLVGLSNYLKKFQYSNAETSDLWKEMQSASGLDIPTIMSSWTQKPGFPIVTAESDGSIGIAMSQKRFYLVPGSNNQSSSADEDTIWQIPVFVKSASGESLNVVFNDKTGNFPFDSSSWYIVNSERFGFYRVNYDAKNWKQLGNVLSTDPQLLSPANRVGLIDDAFNFGRAEIVDIIMPLNLTRYLYNETDYTVWVTALNGLGYFGNQLRVQPSFGSYQNYISKLISPLVGELGWIVGPEDSHLNRQLRTVILDQSARICADKASIQNAVAIFHNFMENPKTTYIHPDIRTLVYYIGVQEGDKDEFFFLWDRFLNTTAATEQIRILRALASTRVPWLLNLYLSYTLDPSKIRTQDAISAVIYVSYNPSGEIPAWHFLRENWDQFYDLLGGGSFSLGKLVSGVTAHFQTQQLYDEVKSFFDGKQLGSAARAVEQSLEAIEGNISWLAKNKVTVENWLAAEAA